MIRNWIAGVILAPLLVGDLAGCTAQSEHDQGPATSPSPSALRLRLGDTIDLGLDRSPLSLDSDLITFPTASPDSALEDSVAVLDLATATSSVVARTGFSHGFINWAVSVADWTVFVDQSEQQSDAEPYVRWRVRAVNRLTRETRTLKSNGNKPDPFVPRVYARDGYVFWSSAEPDRSARESFWRPEWRAPRTVQGLSDFSPTSETIDDGWMYYVGPSQINTDDPRASDCWRVRLDGTGAESLTDSGFVMSCSADGDRLVWATHIDPATPDPPDDGISDDPYELWTRTGDAEPRLVSRGYFSSSVPVVVDAFVIWTDWEGRLTVTSLDHPDISKVLPGEATVQTALYDGTTVVLLQSVGNKVAAHVIGVDDIVLVE